MDEFLLRAILAGAAVALVAGPLGALMVWRRMAYFGSAVSHSALLGVALGFLLGFDPTIGVLAVCVAVALMLLALERISALPNDTLIGMLAHVALAGGLVAIGFVKGLRVDLIGYLFGDVLAVSWTDLAIITLVSAAALGLVIGFWRPLLALTVHEELAAVEGVRTGVLNVVFMILVAVVVAVGMRVVGILLIVSLLIVPAAAARRFSTTPEAMALLAAAAGLVAIGGGIGLAYAADVQAGPSIVLVAGLLFLISLVGGHRMVPRDSDEPEEPRS